MRDSLLVAAACILSVFFVQGQVVKKALFLGNSYTYYNNLPQLVDNFAQAAGNDLFYDSNTPGSYQMNQHASNPVTYQKINQDDWDFVVIQGQSQEPSFPPAQVANDVYPYAAIINDSILNANPCIEPMFFMTWGRKNGDANNCGFYPPICTYDGMQQRLKESYMEMAMDNDASVAPVGVAWKAVRELYPSIELYNPDQSHPSPAGSYLAAAVFYVSMYRESVVNSAYAFSLDSLTAYRLRDVASSTVLDSLPVWRIDANDQSLALPSDTSLCGDSLKITVSGEYFDLAWSTGETMLPSITVESSGIYSAVSTNARFCEVQDSITVTINNAIETVENYTACDSLILSGAVYYADTIITESLTSATGCDSSFTQQINVIEPAEISYSFVEVSGGQDFLYIENANYDSIYIFESLWGNSAINQDTMFYNCQFFGYALTWNSCGMDSVSLSTVCGSIDELSSDWQIGPNPTNRELVIANTTNLGFAAGIYDMLGRRMVENSYDNSSQQVMDINALTYGQYFLVIYDAERKILGKKMIQKR